MRQAFRPPPKIILVPSEQKFSAVTRHPCGYLMTMSHRLLASLTPVDLSGMG